MSSSYGRRYPLKLFSSKDNNNNNNNNNNTNNRNMPARNNIHSIHSNNGDDKDGGFQSWVSTIPLITRYCKFLYIYTCILCIILHRIILTNNYILSEYISGFVATLFFTLLVNFRYVPYHVVAWSWGKIVHNFEIWRFITPFLYAGPFHPTLLFTLHNLLVFSRLHEMRWVDVGMHIVLLIIYCMTTKYILTSTHFNISSPINTGGGAGTSDYVFTLMFGAFGICLSLFHVCSITCRCI